MPLWLFFWNKFMALCCYTNTEKIMNYKVMPLHLTEKKVCAIMTADCSSVLFYNGWWNRSGAAHGGWRALPRCITKYVRILKHQRSNYGMVRTTIDQPLWGRCRSPVGIYRKKYCLEPFIPHNGKYLANIYVSENNLTGKWRIRFMVVILLIHHAFFFSYRRAYNRANGIINLIK